VSLTFSMNRFAKQLSQFAFLLLLTPTIAVSAAEFHLVTGGFLVQASSTTRTGTITNLGAFHGAYERRILPSLELSAGYTILVSGIITGDLSFGLDLGVNYYPFSDSEPFRYVDSNRRLVSTDIWRPYIGAYFAQRQFQVIQSGFAGGGFALGVERALSEGYSLKVIFRHLFFGGTATTSAAETTLLAGITFSF
jgi:uncharacterized membrane protein YeiB